MTDKKSSLIDRGRRDAVYRSSAVAGQHARTHARRAAEWVVSRPVWQLALAVWITHGLLDGAVTVGAVAILEDTTIESNPLLTPYLFDAFWRHLETGSYLAYWRPLAIKFAAAGVASIGVVGVSRCCSKRTTAAFAAGIATSGLLVVVNNLVALRGVVA